jgi:hypothetical protein
MDIRSQTRQNQQARRYVYVGVVLLVIFLPLVIYSRELRLAYSLYRYEGGQTAFTGKPLSAHFVGMVVNTPLPSTLFVTATSGDVRTAAAAHRNGCFVLSAPKPQATVSSYAPGYTPVVAKVEGGYFYVRLKASPVTSGNTGSLAVTPISAWTFIRRTVECTSSR